MSLRTEKPGKTFEIGIEADDMTLDKDSDTNSSTSLTSKELILNILRDTLSLHGGIGGWCRGEPVTDNRKRTQVSRMVIIIMIPMMVLTGITAFYMKDTITDKVHVDEVKDTIALSIQLGRLLNALALERDSSVLYLSIFGPDTKDLVTKNYIYTDQAIDAVTVWPKHYKGHPSYSSKEVFKLLVYLNRAYLDDSRTTIFKVLDFYTEIIDDFIQFISSPVTKLYRTVEDLSRLVCTIKCEQPITDLYRFQGNVIVHEEGSKDDGKTLPLMAEHLLLRGMRLRNTAFVYGCVVYAGRDTKVSLNSRSSTVKMSRVEKSMNYFLIAFLILLAVECSILVALRRTFYSKDVHRSGPQGVWYMDGMDESNFDALDVLVEFLSYMVLLNYIIPISMYVTVEFQKLIGAYFFENDVEMYDPGTNETAKARTSDLNEELGLVEYLFTDKTGTLTENDMQFRQCAIAGVKYVDFGGMLCEYMDIPGVNHQPVFKYDDDVKAFLMALALCHTVRVDVKEGTTQGFSVDGFAYEYQASSPDEKALVEACRRYRVVYHGVKDNKSIVTVDGQKHHFITHHVLDFDPTRKRMSIIMEDETGHTFLLVKGADTAMISKLVSGNPETCERSVTDYALQGLRTLVIGRKELSKELFEEYDELIKSAKSSLQNREEEVTRACTKIEDGLTYLGVTAVEDRLQDGVPETISALREAGIQVWVLTGDKEETAVNISYSAGHFFDGILELRITKMTNEEDCGTAITEIVRILEDANLRGQKNYALIVDGPSLAHVMQKEDLKKELIWICENVVTVLCCRMSPLQKSQVVRLIKTSKSKPVTAAIGDGANDVSMILEAHVGLGLMGKEGRQAVRSSDYAFGRFRFLQRVFLIHGHYFYVRITTLVLYFFYKNIAFITAQFYYAFFNAFSEQTLYESFFLTCYNITFTSLPILVYSIFEKHVPVEILTRKPQFYKLIKRNSALSAGQFILWTFLGLYHSVIFFFGTYAAFVYGSSLFPSGLQFSNYDFGAIVCNTCVIAVNVKLMLHWYEWNWLTVFAFAFTYAGYFCLGLIYGASTWSFVLTEYSMYGSFVTIYSSGICWLLYLLLTVAALLPDFALKAWRDMTSPLYNFRRIKKLEKREQRQKVKEKMEKVCLVKYSSSDYGSIDLGISDFKRSSRSVTFSEQETVIHL